MVTEEDGRWRMRVPLMQRWLRQQGQRESNVRTALGYEAVRAERWLAMGRSWPLLGPRVRNRLYLVEWVEALHSKVRRAIHRVVERPPAESRRVAENRRGVG